MGVLGEIIVKLGWDPTFWWQLGILLALFFILKALVFDKLQYVIEHREERTNKLIDEANALLAKADKIETEYQMKMDVTKEKAKTFFREKREEWMGIENHAVHIAEQDINKEFEKKKLALEEEMRFKKENLQEKTEELSNELVAKLTEK